MNFLRGTKFEAQIRLNLKGHPVVEAFAARFDVPHERAQHVVIESVIDAMELLGSEYVMKMNRVVGRMTQLREAIHFVYERVLTGSLEDIDTEGMGQNFADLRAETRKLVDPKTWAETEGAALPPLPPLPHTPPPGVTIEPVRPPVTTEPAVPATRQRGRRRHEPQYPGARPGLADRPTRAPRKGDLIPGRGGKRWGEQIATITKEIDAEGLLWHWPDLKDDVVLHFPEYGYRVWKEHGTGAVVEELLTGPSVTKGRGLTRGEDVLFTAGDVSEAYRAAKTERAHGAASPGLGLDAPYGVAHAVRRINQWLERSGVELWARRLRDNAEPGVEYLWTTRTQKRGQTLANREYTLSAVVDGQIHELYIFETSVPAGSPPSDTNVDFTLVGASPAADVYGAPVTRKSRAAIESAAQSGTDSGHLIERVEPPKVLVEALGRTSRTTQDLAHPAVQRTGERLENLATLLEGKEVERRGRSELAGAKLLKRAFEAKDSHLIEAIDALTNVVQDLQRDITTGPADPARLARIDAVVKAFYDRAARWTDKVTAADVLALIRQLKALR